MAYGTKYRIEGTSDMFGKVTVDIQKDNYTGAVTTFEAAGRAWVELNIGQGGNDVSLAILPSQCSVQFYAMTDFQCIELATDLPRTWRMDVITAFPTVRWRGFVNPESYNENYHNTPYIVNVVASDGLDELKTIDYPILPGQASLWQHILNCLAQTGIERPFLESVNIYDDSMNDGNEDSPLLQAEVTYQSFLKIAEVPNCYDVLTAILKPFYARIYQYGGWTIENIYEKKGTYRARGYNSNGFYLTNVEVNPIVTLSNNPSEFAAFLGKSGVMSFHPALRQTEIYVNTQEVVNPQETGGFSLLTDWTSATDLVSWTKENSITIERVIEGWAGSETTLRIPGRQTDIASQRNIVSNPISIDPATFQRLSVTFQYFMNYPTIILFGSKPILYLRVELEDTISPGVVIRYYWRSGAWSTTVQYIRIDATFRQTWRFFDFNIGTLPDIVGTAQIKFRIYQLVKKGDQGNTELKITNWRTNLQVDQILGDVVLRETGTITNTSTFKGPSFEHFISDGLVRGREGVMEVVGTLTSNWNRRGKTDNLNIRRLFIKQWLTMHQTQAAKLQGTIHQKGEKIQPLSVIQDNASIDSRKYIITTWRFNLSNGIGEFTAHEIFENEVSPTFLQDELPGIAPSSYIMPDYSAVVNGPASAGNLAQTNQQSPQVREPITLSGDVRGDVGSTELTPTAIVQKPLIDYTGLKSSEIALNIVPDSLNEEQMTKTTPKDLFGAWAQKNTPIGDDKIVIIDSADSDELKNAKIKDLGFVPYTGADKNVNLGEFGLSTGHIVFDTTPTNIPTVQGATYWDEDALTFAVRLNGYIMRIGQDLFYPVKNQTGSNIAKGRAVRFAGTLGASGRLLIAPFIANGTVDSTFFMGVTAEAINNGADGKVLWFGTLRGINTNDFDEGDILYANTATAGSFQKTIPVPPNNIVQIAAVITKSSNVGAIFVRPTIAGRINKLEGVKITTPATGDVLQYKANGLFENIPFGLINPGLISAGVYTTQAAAYESVFGMGSNVISGSLKDIDVSKRQQYDLITIKVIFSNTTSTNNKLGIFQLQLGSGTQYYPEAQSSGSAALSGQLIINIVYIGLGIYRVYLTGMLTSGTWNTLASISEFNESINSNFEIKLDYFSGVQGSPNYGGNTGITHEVRYDRATSAIFA